MTHGSRTSQATRASVGSTVFVNTKPVTIIGVSPKGFSGDRMTRLIRPGTSSPMNAMDPVRRVPEFYGPNVGWAYIIGRVKAGTCIPALQAKASALLKQGCSTPALACTFGDPLGQRVLPRTQQVLTPGGGGIQRVREGYLRRPSQAAAVDRRARSLVACANIADLLLVRWRGPPCGLLHPLSALDAQRSPHRSPAAHRKPAPFPVSAACFGPC